MQVAEIFKKILTELYHETKPFLKHKLWIMTGKARFFKEKKTNQKVISNQYKSGQKKVKRRGNMNENKNKNKKYNPILRARR